MALTDKQQAEMHQWLNELRLGRPHKEYGRDWNRGHLLPLLNEIRDRLAQVPTGKQWEMIFLHLLREGIKANGHAADELKARVREVLDERPDT